MGELLLCCSQGIRRSVCIQEGGSDRPGTSSSAPELPSQPLEALPSGSQIQSHASWPAQESALLLNKAKLARGKKMEKTQLQKLIGVPGRKKNKSCVTLPR